MTIPKAIAERFGLKPGDDVELVPAGEVIRLERCSQQPSDRSRDLRVHLFDQATQRHADRVRLNPVQPSSDRGWTRDELHHASGKSFLEPTEARREVEDMLSQFTVLYPYLVSSLSLRSRFMWSVCVASFVVRAGEEPRVVSARHTVVITAQ